MTDQAAGPTLSTDSRPALGVLPVGRDRGPSDSLPPTARRILDTARSLLGERGYAGLTFDAIAAASGSNKSMIRYYFGSKDGLVAALVDDLTHDATAEFLRIARVSQGTEDVVAAHLAATRRLLADPSFVELFDVLPEALRREPLRELLASLYEWYREIEVVCFGGVSIAADPDLRALASLHMAVIDGLALQLALDRESADTDAAWDLMGSLITTYLDGRHAGGDHAPHPRATGGTNPETSEVDHV